MNDDERFSERYGLQPDEPEITIHYDAPYELRGILVDIAYESGLRPSNLRSIVCHVLRTREDPNNWSDFPNIDGELRYLLDDCEWYEVYDVVEGIYEHLIWKNGLATGPSPDLSHHYFEKKMNEYFRKKGIGWQLEEGKVQVRGPRTFEKAVRRSIETVEDAGLTTAGSEIQESLRALSRRPEPDITGALSHSMAALECVFREVSDDTKATLGEALKKHRGIIPTPLDMSIEKAWGFASEYGRHLREGRHPSLEEVELVVGISSQVITYLTIKLIANK